MSTLAALIPPRRLRLSERIEREIVLPEGTIALPRGGRAPVIAALDPAIDDDAHQMQTNV